MASLPEQPEDTKITISPGTPLTVHFAPRMLMMCSVTEQEIDTLFSSGNASSLHFGFFGISFGTFVSVAIVLATVDLAASPVGREIFTGLAWFSGVSSVFFLISSVRAYLASKKQRDGMKSGAAGPKA
jgi:hypothetical protein